MCSNKAQYGTVHFELLFPNFFTLRAYAISSVPYIAVDTSALSSSFY